MIKVIERVGEVSRVYEFDTVAELVEYEMATEEIETDPLELAGKPVIGREQQKVIDKIAESTAPIFVDLNNLVYKELPNDFKWGDNPETEVKP